MKLLTGHCQRYDLQYNFKLVEHDTWVKFSTPVEKGTRDSLYGIEMPYNNNRNSNERLVSKVICEVDENDYILDIYIENDWLE